jgi:hypothetical protein
VRNPQAPSALAQCSCARLLTEEIWVRIPGAESLIRRTVVWYNRAVRKRSNLGELECPYCEFVVKKVHPWQICCGDPECRRASKRKHLGVTITCEACGVETPKIRSNSRFCPAAECKAISKKGKRVPKVELTCPYCETTIIQRNTRQITCGSEECKDARQRAMRNNARPNKRTGATFKCGYCPTRLVRTQENQVTCGAPECRKKRKKDRDNESFWLLRRRVPKLCGVCDRPLRVKRFRYHKECRKQLATDKGRIQRRRKRLTAEKVRRHKASKPRPSKTSRRMEELKCARQLQRTS